MREILLDQANRLRQQLHNRKSVNIHWELGERLNKLRQSTLALVDPSERDNYAALISELRIDKSKPYTVLPHQGLTACDEIISVLKNLGRARLSSDQPAPLTRVLPESSRVFIVHGHDMDNAQALRRILHERFELDPVILSEEPSKGRSIIEKFEAEAASCAFAFVLFTPDDFVEKDGHRYTQARPNVILELGWFYGRLGRDRVCILFRKGTAIPSDLSGIGRVEFGESIREKVLEIETELEAAGLVNR